MTAPSNESIQHVLYHVVAALLPVGQVLRPYALAQEQSTPIQLVEEALRRGSNTVLQLLTGDKWTQVLARGNRPTEMILLEAVFEHVRIRTTPVLPSRYNAVFAWRILELAIRYRDEYRPTGVIHHCTFDTGTSVERDGAVVVEAFEVADLTTVRAEDLQRVEERAVQYWLGNEPMAFPELLLYGTVVVRGTIDVSAER